MALERFLPCLPVIMAVAMPAWPLHAAPETEAGRSCLGLWQGWGQNTGSPERWSIQLQLTHTPSPGQTAQECGTIEYTRPACGGTLVSCTMNGGVIRAREHYTHNDGHCAPPGRLLLRCEGEVLHYAWLGWERVDTVLRRAPTESSGGPSDERDSAPREGTPPSATGGSTGGASEVPRVHPATPSQPPPTPSPSSRPGAGRSTGAQLPQSSGCEVAETGPGSWIFLPLLLFLWRYSGARADLSLDILPTSR